MQCACVCELIVDDFNPGDICDMLKRMLRVYHTLGFVLSVEMMHYDTSYWTLTFDEATYSSPTRKIIYFIQVSACFDSGQFDSMDLPDFGIGILCIRGVVASRIHLIETPDVWTGSPEVRG